MHLIQRLPFAWYFVYMHTTNVIRFLELQKSKCCVIDYRYYSMTIIANVKCLFIPLCSVIYWSHGQTPHRETQFQW